MRRCVLMSLGSGGDFAAFFVSSHLLAVTPRHGHSGAAGQRGGRGASGSRQLPHCRFLHSMSIRFPLSAMLLFVAVVTVATLQPDNYFVLFS